MAVAAGVFGRTIAVAAAAVDAAVVGADGAEVATGVGATLHAHLRLADPADAVGVAVAHLHAGALAAGLPAGDVAVTVDQALEATAVSATVDGALGSVRRTVATASTPLDAGPGLADRADIAVAVVGAGRLAFAFALTFAFAFAFAFTFTFTFAFAFAFTFTFAFALALGGCLGGAVVTRGGEDGREDHHGEEMTTHE